MAATSGPIIGGYGKYKYEYIPTLLEFPAGAEVQHVHGLEVDKQGKSPFFIDILQSLFFLLSFFPCQYAS